MGLQASVWLVVGVGVAAAFQMIGHWFPWRMWTGKMLPRIPAYVWGMVGVIGGFAVWACASGAGEALLALVIVSVAAGAAVVMAYGLDHLALRQAQARMANREIDDQE